MKEYIMSIRPEWVELIRTGEKLVDVRTTAPNPRRMSTEKPATVWIYETKAGGGRGAVVGWFMCPSIRHSNMYREEHRRQASRLSCVSEEGLLAMQGKRAALWLWEISDPQWLERPRPLAEFGIKCPPMSWRGLK